MLVETVVIVKRLLARCPHPEDLIGLGFPVSPFVSKARRPHASSSRPLPPCFKVWIRSPICLHTLDTVCSKTGTRATVGSIVLTVFDQSSVLLNVLPNYGSNSIVDIFGGFFSHAVLFDKFFALGYLLPYNFAVYLCSSD